MKFLDLAFILGLGCAAFAAEYALGVDIQQEEAEHIESLTSLQAEMQQQDGAAQRPANPWQGPDHRSVTGTPTLACVAIKWADNASASVKHCKNMATAVANFYSQQSRGKLKMVPIAKEFTTSLPCKKSPQPGILEQAEAQVKKEIKAHKYIIPVTCPAHRGNHANNDIAHLTQYLNWLASHETGHLLGMGHSNAYQNGAYQQYADHTTIMGGGMPKLALNAAQKYWLGWLPQDEVAIFDPSISVYELKSASDAKTRAKSILFFSPEMNGGSGPVMAISASDFCGEKPCGRYYQWSAGSSNLRAGFDAKGFTDDKNGLKMQVISKNNGVTKFRVTLEPVTVKAN